jgi:hypothetical protein
MQLPTFGAWSATIGSIGAGALTQSPEYSFLALPVAIASGVVWLVVLAVFVVRNRKGIRTWMEVGGSGRMILGLSLVFGGCAMGVVGLSIIAAGDRKPQPGNTDKAAAIPLPFTVARSIYAEAHSIKTKDGQETNLYENSFYLVVGNASEDGRSLKRVQARIQGYETPVLLATIRGTTVNETDIRHGELAYFMIGRIISSGHFGPFKGNTTLDDDKFLEEYKHNVPLGAIAFEVWSAELKRQFSLNQWPHKSYTWSVPVVISADDTKSIRVNLKVSLDDQKSSVSLDEEKLVGSGGRDELDR